MFGRTLSFYFARHFAKMVGAIFLLTFLLITAVTYIEFFNRAFKGEAALGFTLALASLFRVPRVAEDALPFCVLYGSIAAFVIANRRLEVVVARAAGVSAWQFLLPACVVGLLVGSFATFAYNPAASSLMAWSNKAMAELFASGKQVESVTGGPVWIRQSAGGTESIIGAAQTFDQGLGLAGVTIYVFEPGGKFRERIDATTAQYTPGEWLLEDVLVTALNSTPERLPTYRLPTILTPNEVRRTFQGIDTISFWSLRQLTESARRAGLPTDRYELEYYALLSRPILLLAMVLIAANVSLRFSRSRNVGRMIITGVGVGFMLYVLMKIARDLGSGGIVPPALAAWLPAIVATLVGATVLLHLEDG
jgi:lipopolysaccharide export system permease protein